MDRPFSNTINSRTDRIPINKTGYKVFVNRSLNSTKHMCKGKPRGLKKSPSSATLR